MSDTKEGAAERIEKEMLKGFIDLIILALLWKEDLYGYELGKRVKAKTQEGFELKEGTLYLAFKRLEENGLVRSYWGDQTAGGGRRKYYRLLPAGRKHLQARKSDWERLKKIVDQFLKGVEIHD